MSENKTNSLLTTMTTTTMMMLVGLCVWYRPAVLHRASKSVLPASTDADSPPPVRRTRWSSTDYHLAAGELLSPVHCHWYSVYLCSPRDRYKI